MRRFVPPKVMNNIYIYIYTYILIGAQTAPTWMLDRSISHFSPEEPMQRHEPAGTLCILGCSIVLPFPGVPGPGCRGRFWASFGRKPNANGPTSGPRLSGPSARAVWDRVLVRSQWAPCQNRFVFHCFHCFCSFSWFSCFVVFRGGGRSTAEAQQKHSRNPRDSSRKICSRRAPGLTAKSRYLRPPSPRSAGLGGCRGGRGGGANK